MKKMFVTAALCGVLSFEAPAATQVWTAGGTGTFGDSTKYNGGVGPAPATNDDVTSDGAGSVITFGAANTITLTSLQLNTVSGSTIFNHSGGDLTLTTLLFGGPAGTSPTYNFSSGNFNVTTTWTWGSGTTANFNLSGGTVNTAAALSPGAAGAVGTITVSSGTFNHTNAVSQFRLGTTAGGVGNIVMTGGVFNSSTPQMRIGAAGNGTMTLSGNAVFNLPTAGTTYLGNNGASGTLTMSGTSQFNASGHVLSVGQFGNNPGNQGVINMNGGTLTATRLALGGDNAASTIIGIVNLNAGTISTGAIRLGASSIAASSTANVLHANGGTVQAVTNAFNSNFFQGAFVDIQAGGLNFDTNGNAVTIANVMSGVGGLTKLGTGVLTLSGVNTYTGDTRVQAGTLSLSNIMLADAADLFLTTGGILDITFAGTDTINQLFFDGVEQSTGTWGAAGSGAMFTSAFFTGTTGTLTVIPEPSTYALLGAGLMVLAFARRKRLAAV